MQLIYEEPRPEHLTDISPEKRRENRKRMIGCYMRLNDIEINAGRGAVIPDDVLARFKEYLET